MKKFTFTLQPVLEHRERIEDEKQQVVALRLRALKEAEQELERLNAEFRLYSERLQLEHKRLKIEDLRLHYAHLQFLDRNIVAQIRVLAERRVALDRARVDLQAASKERKVVERLKEKRREAHAAEESRIEQNELDDANNRRYGRILGGTHA
jgi:flagellar FliJ protein